MIEAAGVSKAYGRGVYALKDLSLRVDKGEANPGDVKLSVEGLSVRDSRGVVFSWQKQKARTDATDGADFMQRFGRGPLADRLRQRPVTTVTWREQPPPPDQHHG